jgi:hypothetical protein
MFQMFTAGESDLAEARAATRVVNCGPIGLRCFQTRMISMTNMNSKPDVTKPAVAQPKPETVFPKVDAAKHESPAPATKV